MLATLLTDRRVRRSAEDLLGAVWGARPPTSGANVVSVYLYRLRSALRAAGAGADVIVRVRGGYQIAPAVAVDVDRFEELLEAAAAAQAGDRPADAERALCEATALCTGEPLAGLPGPYLAAERQRLRERGLHAWRQLAQLWTGTGRADAAIDALTRLVADHPHDESIVALLMRARYRAGHGVDALQDYQNLRARLVGDLGVEPGQELRALHQAVLRGDEVAIGLGRRIAPASGRTRNELPADLPGLDGRDDAVAELTGLLGAPGGTARLVAVDGTAGVGKTALVVHVAHRLSAELPDGTLFLDLHGHTAGRQPLGPADALHRLLRTIGVPDRDVPDDLDERAAVWRAATADSELLVVLDNAATSEQVRPLLPGGAANRVLVTSRNRLVGLDVDRQLTLPVLTEAAGVAVLARQVGDDRADLEPDAVRTVVRLCGGLPLALRIAAARLRTRSAWTFAQLADRLADGGRRLTELTVGDRSIESALALSYGRLPEPERRLFRLLGEIPGIAPDRHCAAALGGLTPVAAERLLENIVDASLLDATTPGRYRMHDLVADFVRRLAATDPDPQALDRVLAHQRAAARAASALLSGTGQPGCGGTVPFTDAAGAREWLCASRTALVELVDLAVAAGRVAVAHGIVLDTVDLYTMRTWFGDARRMHESVLAVDDDPVRCASLRISAANVHGMRGAYEQAWRCFRQANTEFRRLGDEHGEARTLGGMGAAARSLGRHREASRYLSEALEIAERLDHPKLKTLILSNLGMLHGRMRRTDLALTELRAALALAEQRNDLRLQTVSVCALGELLRESGSVREAAGVLTDALELAERCGDVLVRAFALTHLGAVAASYGDVDTAIARHLTALGIVGVDAVETTIQIRGNLGDAYLAAGRTDAARAQFVAVLELTEQAPNPRARASALKGLARC